MDDAILLKNGEQLVIHTLEPPLGDYADQVGCWGDVRDDLLGGVFQPWLFTPYFVGEIDGEVVGSMSYYTPTDRREVGVVEFVQTKEAHRQKGISSQLMARLIQRFLEDQGKALYLCTTNPVAGHLYENFGFWYHVGDGMRYLAPDAQDFDRTYWAFCGKGKIRAATWGDLPRLSALYNHPEPQWLLKDYLTQTFGEMRYESHFVKLMRRIENDRGAFLILENLEKRVVGAAAFERCGTFFEQHIATLGFRICPAYKEQATELLEAAVEAAGSLGIRTLQVPIAARDEDQIALVASAGFSEEARFTDRLRV
ncbi:MAG: GNAT family N-acetyltransferase, partial [bacterium]|nr:GNAT family N-acetyltransferase [bacterium]